MTMKNPPHPGEIIRELCLEPMGLTVTRAALGLGVSRKNLSLLLNATQAFPQRWLSGCLRPLAAVPKVGYSFRPNMIWRKSENRPRRSKSNPSVTLPAPSLDELPGATHIKKGRDGSRPPIFAIEPAVTRLGGFN